MVDILLERFSGERFLFRYFFVEIHLVGMIPQIFFGRGFFWNLFGEIFIQSLLGREFPITDCLVDNFSSDIFV